MAKLTWSKKKAVEIYADTGTLKDVADELGISKKDLLAEMNRSKVFNQKMKEAGKIGRQNIADNALKLIKDYSAGEYPKTDRNQLTASIALANAYVPDFKVKPVFQPTKQTFNVITGIPRPKYIEKPAELKEAKTTAIAIRSEDKEKVG